MIDTDEWSISCRDIAGRPRTLRVMVRDGEVLVIAPPGEIAVLDAVEAEHVRASLREAAALALAVE
ncbi:hypothetical protein ALI144C_22455 [Actinosynnema sp. ALI-1.44]|nr:hypothetical protein ALI144C_22455 [Actinosynnema sp. ALI-1.44]